MSLSTFDTHKFVRRLEKAGVPLEQAEVQAEVLTEAFNVNLESLVTKEYLNAQLVEQRAYTDTRFAEMRAAMDARFAEIDGKFRFFYWTQAIVVAAVVLPLLQQL